MSYYNISGKISSNAQGLDIDNRAFRYADALFESMYFTNGKIQLIEEHWSRIQNSMSLLKMGLPSLPGHNDLEQATKDLMEVNNIKGAARIRLQVFRKSGGFYLPIHRDCDYLLEAQSLENEDYILNKKGLKVGIAENVKIAVSSFSQIKTTSKLEMVLGALEAEDKSWNDAILLNSAHHIAEATGSNVFILNDGQLFTPRIEDGALNGIMRQHIINIARNQNMDCFQTFLTVEDLINADEVFLTNAVRGIQWVEQFGDKVFGNKISSQIVKELNKNMEL